MEGRVVLGFDVGTRWVGVAVSNTLITSSRPVGVLRLKAQSVPWDTLDAWVSSWGPDVFVVGNPLNMDGTRQPMTGRALRFAKQLADRYEKPFELVDERLTSYAARDRKKQKIKTDINAESACVIVDQWLKSKA